MTRSKTEGPTASTAATEPATAGVFDVEQENGAEGATDLDDELEVPAVDTADEDTEEMVEPAPAAAADPAEAPVPHTPDATNEWYRHESGRYVVGDPGRQLEIVPVLSKFDRPDTVLDGATVGSIVFRAASLRGLSHQQTGKTRQDAFGFQVTSNQAWLVGAVADGVSSGPRSHEAADIAVRRLTEVLARALDDVAVPDDADARQKVLADLPWQQAVTDASDAILAEATGQVRAAFVRQGQLDRAAQIDAEGMPVGAAARIMATTAIAFVIATSGANGAVPYAVLPAAGDTSALVLNDEGWHPITAVKNEHAEIASSSVRPLPGRYEVAPVIDVLDPGEALVVITDGVGDPLGAGTSSVGRFLGRSWAEPPDVLEFAHQVGFVRRTFVDDRTAMVAWNAP